MDVKTIFISSRNRTSGTSDDFIIEDTNERYINTPISMKAKTITIPFTWYNVVPTDGISSGNTHFVFTGSVSGSHDITLAPGSYTGSALAEELAKQLNIATGSPSGMGPYTVVYDVTTGKYTIASTSESMIIDFTVVDNMSVILGFDEVVTADAMSQVSTGVASILPDYEIWVCTDLINGVDTGIANWTGNSPINEQMGILACVPITTCFGGIIHYTVPDEFPFYTIVNSEFIGGDPRQSGYYLRFPSGMPMSLNGNEWSMQVLFDFNR